MTCKYVTNPKYLLLCYFLSIVYYVHILAFSIKSGNQGTSTLTLVQKRVRFLKIPSKKHISLQGGGGVTCPSGRGLTLGPSAVGPHGGVRWYQAGGLGFDSPVRQTGSGREATNTDQKGF
jgi:hypothetical protein